jgi:outer membrane protein TolC
LAAARGLLDGRERELTKWLPSGAPERLKIDEFWRKPQNCSTMKSFSVLLVFILTAFPVVAQTDTNTTAVPAEASAPAVPADTNTPAASPAAQTDTNVVAMPTGTNSPVLQPDANTATVQTNTNVVAAPTNANTAATPADPNPAAARTNTMATVTARPMSLNDCLQEALQHNLDVQIERYNPQISLYTLRSDYGGYDPTLTISGQHQYNDTGPYSQGPGNSYEKNIATAGLSQTPTPWGMTYELNGNVSRTYNSSISTNDSSGGQAGVTLIQPLLKNFWMDQTRLTIRLAKNQLKSDEQGLRLQFINSITAVENAYYELIYAQENVKVQQEALILAQTQLDQDRQRVQIGTKAQLDVQQDEAQVATSKANLIAAQYTLANDQNTLKNLITDQYAHWHDMDIQPTETITNAPLQLFDLQDSWSKGMTKRPDLLQKRLLVERQGIQLKFDNNQLFPEMDLTGSYGYNGAGMQYNDVFTQVGNRDRPFYSYGAELKVPLSNVGARNTYKADKVTLQQLLLKLKQFEQGVLVDIDNAVKKAQSDYQSVEASRQARIYAEAALDAEQKKYAVGKSTTFNVLGLQNTLTSDRGTEIRDLANYYEDLANLAQSEGSTLERHHITVEAR